MDVYLISTDGYYVQSEYYATNKEEIKEIVTYHLKEYYNQIPIEIVIEDKTIKISVIDEWDKDTDFPSEYSWDIVKIPKI